MRGLTKQTQFCCTISLRIMIFIPRALSTVSRLVVGPDVRSRWFLTFLTAQGRFVGLPPFDIPILRVRGHVLY